MVLATPNIVNDSSLFCLIEKAYSAAITRATECLAETDTITALMLKDFNQLLRMFLTNKILSEPFFVKLCFD